MNVDSSQMFTKHASLANVDAITKWDASNVANMSSMFEGVKALT